MCWNYHVRRKYMMFKVVGIDFALVFPPMCYHEEDKKRLRQQDF